MQLFRCGQGWRVAPPVEHPVNSWELDPVRVLNNAELSDLTIAIGTGLFHEGMSEEDVEAAIAKLRYHKIIFLSDADSDGAHIRCLLQGFFFKHMMPLVKRGYVYIGTPPLYRVTEKTRQVFLRDEKAMGKYIRSRVESVAKSNEDVLKLAEHVMAVDVALDKMTVGTSLGSISVSAVIHAIARTMIDPDQTKAYTLDDLAAFFKDYLISIKAEGIAIQKVASEKEGGAFTVFALLPNGSFMSFLFDIDIYNTIADAWYELLETRFGEDYMSIVNLAAKKAPIEIANTQVYGISGLVQTVVKEAYRGINIQRNKGLGEMQARQLGETTLDPMNRRLIKLTSADFDEAGVFIGEMLAGKHVQRRREVIGATAIDPYAIDA